ncbi:MAG: aminotransferase class V-fold PLP-dependent enzyme [Streptosporangiales bacterium]|nr:aminotransferase class V-fold PLP-dependent enzyme [Streptosporangiales bacterium]
MTGSHPALEGGPIFLDYNATTPVDPRVAEATLPYLTHHFGNPSSGHAYAEQPRRALAEARGRLADMIGAQPEELAFTAGGSEADALALRGVPLTDGPGAHIITQVTEHPAVLETCSALQRLHGIEVTYLPVDGDGLVDPRALADAFTQRTALVSIMTANNETGVLQPIAELARLTHEHGAIFHTDAAQAAGKIPLDVRALGVDLLTIAGHKMYAPKGIGALYVRSGLRLEPLIHGGGQERGLRAGTENIALAVALGAAAHIAEDELVAGAADRIRALRDLLHGRLDTLLPGLVQLNGHPDQRLPNTLNISITGVTADDLLSATPAVAAATGLACHTGSPEPSPVLLAMGHDPGRGLSALRLTLGRWTARDEVERAAEQLAANARHLLAA